MINFLLECCLAFADDLLVNPLTRRPPCGAVHALRWDTLKYIVNEASLRTSDFFFVKILG